MNSAQKAIVVVSVCVLLSPLLFPPWQQTAEGEPDYRKNLGRAGLLHPPKPVAVDCYFTGCKTAPPSYFHVLPYWTLIFAQALSTLAVALAAFWMFRSRRDGTCASLASRRTRLVFSTFLALLVPSVGTFPLAYTLLSLPEQVIHPGELGPIPTIAIVAMFVVCVWGIYLLLSLALWIRSRTQEVR